VNQLCASCGADVSCQLKVLSKGKKRKNNLGVAFVVLNISETMTNDLGSPV